MNNITLYGIFHRLCGKSAKESAFFQRALTGHYRIDFRSKDAFLKSPYKRSFIKSRDIFRKRVRYTITPEIVYQVSTTPISKILCYIQGYGIN